MKLNSIPVATYRFQLHAGFPLSSARNLADYLEQLGISYLYLSPVTQATTGSTHGYDVIDPTKVSSELGSEAELQALAEALHAKDMGILLDIVPNHMAASVENPWWRAVLRDGPDAVEASYFDIDWNPPRPGLAGKVLLPVLGDHYAEVLERGELGVETDDGGSWLRYYDSRFPISTDERSRQALGRYLDAASQAGSEDYRLASLDELIETQHYRLSFWRAAARAINYRRFFDINDLVSVRTEDEQVFTTTHEYVATLVKQGLVNGLRIDHVDGLRDPGGYLKALQQLVANDAGKSCYVLVEKILTGDETMPADWPVAGTTGYDFLNMVIGLLTDGSAFATLHNIATRMTGVEPEFHDFVHRAKHEVMNELFPGDRARLAWRIAQIASGDRHGRDLTLEEIDAAIGETTASLPVYRTYITSPELRPDDREIIEAAVNGAIRRRPDLTFPLGFVRRLLLFEDAHTLDEEEIDRRLNVIARWQQFTGPVMAKGLEDTALYRDATLLSANTVGGEPDTISRAAGEFHAWIKARQANWPHSMNATSTHDSKRSEDVRTRISVLSEMTDEWESRLGRWRRLVDPLRAEIDGRPVPGGRGELILFQTLVGAWPLDDREVDEFRGRIKDYMVKAEREAKLRTSWINQDPEYEEALTGFVDALFDSQSFLRDFAPFQRQVAYYGALKSLSQTLLKLTVPGVPDFYQGTEIWNFSLVDPDNRRPVDFDLRRALLGQVAQHDDPAALLHTWKDGRVKLFLTHRCLQLRHRERQLFQDGGYIPLQVTGSRNAHAIAFARHHEDTWALVVAPMLTARLTRDAAMFPGQPPVGPDLWDDTAVELPGEAPTTWRDEFTGNAIEVGAGRFIVGDLFSEFPYALLTARGRQKSNA